MRPRILTLFWGFILILAGALFLAGNFGLIPEPSGFVWAILFAAASLSFFASYFISGVRNWGWLFPAFITGAVAAVILLGELGISGPFIATMILWSIAIPFLVVFVQAPSENWWALIPAYVMGAVGAFILIVDRLPGEWVASLVMFLVALPFLAVYVINRENWWALIPGGIMILIGFVLLLLTQASGEVIGALILFAIALPFFVVFLRSPDNWWALIPAGVMASAGLTALLAGALSETAAARWLGGVMFLGMALTFGVLWLLRARQPTEWAKYPAIGLAIAGLVAVSWGAGIQIIWPLALIAVGGWLLWDVLRRREDSA